MEHLREEIQPVLDKGMLRNKVDILREYFQREYLEKVGVLRSCFVEMDIQEHTLDRTAAYRRLLCMHKVASRHSMARRHY